jgi:probable rRNA maturation factor
MIEINNKTRSRINERHLKKVIERFFAYYGIKNKDLSVAIVGDRAMRRLNRTCRGIDRPTDVLAFPDKDKNYFGEIILCRPQIERQAGKFAGSAEKELVFVLVHGLLHLLGYDDKTARQQERMNALTAAFIEKL